jgi:ankyrin repeat protein
MHAYLLRMQTGVAPLHYAVWKGHTECATLLLDAGAAVDGAANVRRGAAASRSPAVGLGGLRA